MSGLNLHDLPAYFEHSALQATVAETEIQQCCEEAIANRCRAVVVNSLWIPLAKQMLQDSPVRLVSTCNFPLGASKTSVALSEAMKAVEDGADEIDLVAAIGKLRANQFAAVEDDLHTFRNRIPSTVQLKVIIEAPLLNEGQIVRATEAVISSGAECVKTGTGFNGAATVEQVRMIAEVTNGRIGLKAAGGIRTLGNAVALIEAGATRLGSSHSVAILAEAKAAAFGSRS